MSWKIHQYQSYDKQIDRQKQKIKQIERHLDRLITRQIDSENISPSIIGLLSFDPTKNTKIRDNIYDKKKQLNFLKVKAFF